MPETYTGDEGDDALAASLDVMDGTEDRKDGWLAINKTRDYIAQLKTWVTSQISSISLTWSAISGKPSTFPPDTHTHSSLSTGPVSFGWSSGLNRWNTAESIAAASAVFGGNVNVGGDVYVASSTGAVSSYTIAYINGDGRLSRGVSSIRYKDLLDDPDVNALGDIWPPLREFTMKADDDATPILGYIAEELAENPATDRFAVRIENTVESIDFIQLLLVQVAQLNARLAALEDS